MVQKTLTKIFRVQVERACPICGHRMVRVRRKAIDRMISNWVPVIRCSCCGRSVLVHVRAEELNQ